MFEPSLPTSRLSLLLAGCVLTSLGGCSSQEALPPSGVLITVDTTNTGALDIYAKDRGVTPRVEALAKEGVTFDRAYTTAPITLPAHTSMLTGLYPLRHGVRENGLMRLSPEAETLAERAQEAGFQTAAFVSAMVLARTYGLDQGFDVYEVPTSGKNQLGAPISERRSNEVTDAALGWLASRDTSRPFFLWVHYFDPHAPYDPPTAFLQLAGGNNYLGEVASMDADIGRLLDGLDEFVGKDQHVLSIVADHGESLNRHGEASHGGFIYDSTTRVPMVLRFPDGRRAGERFAGVVSVTDLFPTFLQEMGLGSAGDVDGLSLSNGTQASDRGVYIESYYGYFNFGWSPLSAWVDSKGKYLHSSLPEFYDLGSDPGEKKNLYGTAGTDPSEYIAAIEQLSQLPRLLAGGEVNLDQEDVLELRKLGYASLGRVGAEGPPGPLEPSDGLAPSKGAKTYADFAAASGMVHRGENKKAVNLLRGILKDVPDHMAALESLGGVLAQQGEYLEATQLFERILVQDSSRYPARVFLAGAYEALGDFKSALEHLEAAQLIRPDEKALEMAVLRVTALSLGEE